MWRTHHWLTVHAGQIAPSHALYALRAAWTCGRPLSVYTTCDTSLISIEDTALPSMHNFEPWPGEWWAFEASSLHGNYWTCWTIDLLVYHLSDRNYFRQLKLPANLGTRPSSWICFRVVYRWRQHRPLVLSQCMYISIEVVTTNLSIGMTTHPSI